MASKFDMITVAKRIYPQILGTCAGEYNVIKKSEIMMNSMKYILSIYGFEKICIIFQKKIFFHDHMVSLISLALSASAAKNAKHFTSSFSTRQYIRVLVTVENC